VYPMVPAGADLDKMIRRPARAGVSGGPQDDDESAFEGRVAEEGKS
jgi:hypothetical protein